MQKKLLTGGNVFRWADKRWGRRFGTWTRLMIVEDYIPRYTFLDFDEFKTIDT